MASETSDRGESRYDANSGAQDQAQDSFFASAHHDHSGDDVFSAGQPMDAQNQPVQQVPIAAGSSVIRVQVTPGEVLELAPPFTPDANMIAREADGNLAIKVGDVTVILQGFIEANNTAPVVVESSDGKPIDIATVIAQTDPTIDIQTAAGPAAGAQGQGADNTGAILAQLAGGAGLGGLNAVGAQDQTSLTYGTIDNSIIQDRFLAAGVLGGTSPFSGLSEPFLRDPMHVSNFNDFTDFFDSYKAFVNGNPGDGWADFTGTQASGDDFDSYLAKTSFSSVIGHNGTDNDSVKLDAPDLTGWTSNGEQLQVDAVHSTDETLFIERAGDHALVLVIHIHTAGDVDGTGTMGAGDYQIDTFLINRLDHPDHGDGVTTDSVSDILSLTVPYEISSHDPQNPESQPTVTPGTTTVDILDDVPVAHDVHYTSYYGDDNFAPGAGGDDGVTTAGVGSHHHESFTSTDKGYVDEDWLKGNWGQDNQGNKDQDNDPAGSNSDKAHGDDLGRTYVLGNLDIDFGADGPAGAGGGGNDCLFTPGSGATLALGLDNVPAQGDAFKDASGNTMTSDGHQLVVLEHYTDSHGLEHLIVGYNSDEGEGAKTDNLFATSGLDTSGCVKVFELTLDTNPDDNTSTGKSPLEFQDFKFELIHGIDQPNNPGGAEPTESNTNLHFDVVGHDDDGDAVHTGVNIQVNDDVPTVGDTCYVSFKGGTSDVVTEATALGFLTSGEGGYGGMIKSTDFGMVDEDWLKGGGANDTAGGPGNQDQDGNGNSNAQQNGDDYGKTLVFGSLNVNFGGDGPIVDNPLAPGKQALELKTFSVGDTFKDADGHTFTSGDHVLVVLSSSAGHLEVGFKGGEGGNNDIPIFSLDLGTEAGSWNFGDFCFTLEGPLDHTPITGPDGAETSLPIHFDVTATDADFDTAHADIKIQVNDDKPEIAVTYYNEIPDGGSTGGSEGTFGVAVGPSGYTGAGQVDEDWLSNGNHDQDALNNPNPGQHGDKDGFTTVTGNLNVKYGGDGPGTVSDFVLGGTEGAVVQAKDDNGNTADLKTDDGSTVHLHVETVGDHQILVGYSNSDNSDAFTGDSNEVFKLDLDTSTGGFQFDLYESVSHPIAGTEDNLLLNFGITAGTDGDGDVAVGSINITINDDLPETGVTYVNKDNENVDCPADTGATFGQVDEDFLRGGNEDKDNSNPAFDTDPVRGDDWGNTTVTGQIGNTNFGADGEGNAPTGAFALTTFPVNGTDPFLDANGNPVTQHGNNLVVLFSDATGLAVGLPGGHPVFTLTLDQSTDTFKFTLLGSLDELPGASSDPVENNLLLSFLATNGATDGDGDPVTAYINIQVNDDAPVAVNDYQDVEGTTSGGDTVSGNVLKNDMKGADGAFVSLIVGTGGSAAIAEGGHQTIAGDHGDLTIYANGDYTYVPHDGDEGSDTFTYTLKDGDGDTTTATLTLNYIEEDSRLSSVVVSGPTHTPGHYDVTMAVTHTTVESPLTATTYHITDATGGHVIVGGGGNDLIEVSGSQGSTLSGAGGDDIIHATAGHNTISGGDGDDTLFGGSGVDDFFGGKGHDAMSGGGGDDVFHNVDAQDLDGTNTLDGTHSIDGGAGFDTVDLHGLPSFDSSQAIHIENVEALDFSGKASGGGGSNVTLSYDAVYGITQVGGLHALQISGDASGAGKDNVHLDNTGGHTWSFVETKGGFDTYTAAGAQGDVTVQVEHGVHTDLN